MIYGHSFSSYSQKAHIGLYKNATPFEFKVLGPATPENFEALNKLWPIAKFPVLEDEGVAIFEATMIIEHLAIHHAGRGLGAFHSLSRLASSFAGTLS